MVWLCVLKRCVAWRRKISPSTGVAYSEGVRLAWARSWSVASHSDDSSFFRLGCIVYHLGLWWFREGISRYSYICQIASNNEHLKSRVRPILRSYSNERYGSLLRGWRMNMHRKSPRNTIQLSGYSMPFILYPESYIVLWINVCPSIYGLWSHLLWFSQTYRSSLFRLI